MGMLSVRREKILIDEQKAKAYIYVKRGAVTTKYFFDQEDWISSLPNKPTSYFIRINNRCVDD